MELTTLKFVATVFLATAIVEAYNLREPQLQEATDVYIVVFKEEVTAQESKKNKQTYFLIRAMLKATICLSIQCHAVDLHKESVKKMGNVGPILNEYNIGNDFRGYSAPMTKL